MSRLEALQARRAALLARCEPQRCELSDRLGQVGPAALLARLTRRPGGAAPHPLRTLATVATVLMMLRERRLLGWIGKLTFGASMLSRAATVVRLFRRLRGTIGAGS